MKSMLLLCLLSASIINAAPPQPQVVSIYNESAVPAPTATTAAESVNYILDRTFVPEEYIIQLKTYLADIYDEKDRFVFNGSCAMKFKYVGSEIEARNFTIHAKNLKNMSYELFEIRNGKELKKEITFSKPHNLTDKVEIECKSGFRSGTTYLLKSSYIGQMEDDMHGFYRSQYEDDKGNKKWLASTQFETHHARRAFPGFDEPYFKAVYKISINRHKVFNVAANTRLISSVKDPFNADRYIDTFEPTPKMSTYLIAFLVSEFLARSNGDFSVIARPEYYSQTQYAGEIGPKLLDELNNYTDIEYRTVGGGDHKMAMAAIPDFSAGAMENWGLLTYRERALLFDEKESSLSYKQSIAGVIAHEQAHMWFGDLVTCDWWGFAWLNEGFARHWQYFTAHAVIPEFEMDKQFPVDQIQSVFGMDSLPGVKPMTDPSAATPADMSRMFNSITYNKGGAILRNIKHIMGEENFQKALREYLKTYSFGNTRPYQLFEILDKYWPVEDKRNVRNTTEFYESWTEQVGYPVLNITLSADGKSFTVTQERFLLKDKSVDKTSNRTLTYVVPLTYTTSNEKDFENTRTKAYLRRSKEVNFFNLSNQVEWIMANIQQVGYYRVFYDQRTLHKLHHALSRANHSDIAENNRAQFVDDLLTFARAGFINYNEALMILEYIENDQSYIPWTSALNGLSTLAVRLGAEKDDKIHFKNYINFITDKLFRNLGFNEKKNERILDIYLRNSILRWACKYGNADCIKQAKILFEDLRKNGRAINPNIRSAIYCTAMREGTKEDFEFLYKKWKKETVSTEQTLLISVMGCVKDDELVEKYFKIILNEIRRQDKSSAINSLYSENDANVDKVFKLTTENYQEFDKSFGSVGSSASTLAGIASRFTTEIQKQRLVDFKSKPEVRSYYGESVTKLDDAVKTVDENLAWAKSRLGSARQYFKAKSSGTMISVSFLLLAFSTALKFVFS